jgi:hypothetical protein
MAEDLPNRQIVHSWKWFWAWMMLSAAIGILARLLGGAFGVYGWAAAAIAVIALVPILARIEYKITGRQFPRAKKY